MGFSGGISENRGQKTKVILLRGKVTVSSLNFSGSLFDSRVFAESRRKCLIL